MNAKNAVKILSAAVCILAAQAVFAQKVPGPEGSKMELKWPNFQMQKDSADSFSRSNKPFYIKGREGRMMDLSNLTASIQRRVLESKKRQVQEQEQDSVNKPAEPKSQPVPSYLMGREGHMMQLGETVNQIWKKFSNKKDKKEQAKPKKDKKESAAERLSQPGRLQAL